MPVVDGPEPPTGDSVADWHDAETGMLGPRAWAEVLGVESARCRRYGRTATVVVVDVSGLDDLDAAWGSDIGAIAVARVGGLLRSGARASDYFARIEPRRFAILLPETDEVAAVNFVERVRSRCDAAIRSAGSGGRCRFGWADARRSRPLDAAAEVAISRLASDEEAGAGA